jgi:hypothetical protein
LNIAVAQEIKAVQFDLGAKRHHGDDCAVPPGRSI